MDHMHRILLLNSKGGCGKSTVATNLAGYFAHRGRDTALIDYDRQGSSTQWLNNRPKNKNPIHSITAFKSRSDLTRTWQLHIPAQSEIVIMDAPAGITGFELADYVARVDTILIPVLPSPIDIHATAHFIEELLLVGKARSKGVNIAVFANRVRETTKVYKNLRKFLLNLKLPFVGTLRDSQDYIRASETGMSIHEFVNPNMDKSCQQWATLLSWLDTVPHKKRVQQPMGNIFPAFAKG